MNVIRWTCPACGVFVDLPEELELERDPVCAFEHADTDGATDPDAKPVPMVPKPLTAD